MSDVIFQSLPPEGFETVTHTVDEFEDKSKKKTNKKYTKEQFEAGMQIDAFMMNGPGTSCTVESHLSKISVL